jgi:hypothetical protein
VLDETMSHRDMNLAIYEEESPIAGKILELLR